MRTNTTRSAGSTPARRPEAPHGPVQRRRVLRVVRDERRRLERPRSERFDYLRRVYD